MPSSSSVLVSSFYIKRNTYMELESTKQYTCMAQCYEFGIRPWSLHDVGPPAKSFSPAVSAATETEESF